jgi:tRNA-splicing ligase RtcB
LEQVGPCQWKIPKSYKDGMRVDGMIYADQRLIDQIRRDQAPEQVANVATLPGIQKYSFAMPDIHWGYGFTIGGVAATDPEEGGVISPGGVGYDINCGVRVIRSNLNFGDVQHRARELVDELFRRIPTGVGRTGKYCFKAAEMRHLLAEGPRYLVRERGLGTPRDIEFTEAGGHLDGADPDRVSDRAFARGEEQCGTLGSGNHFLEVQVLDRVLDDAAARTFGLFEGQVVVMIHSGSRGLGYQVCDDALARLRKAPEKYGIELPDRQLVCAPVHSPEGREYVAAMRAAAHFAWCNRQLLMQQTREVFATVFGRSWHDLDMELIYDVAHNIAKFERHDVGGKDREVCVHRKGATRAFPPGHPEIPDAYRAIGQPVLIPGSMGTASWLLVGQPGAMEQTFGTTCHGAGRQMSRTAAVKEARGRQIDKELERIGIIARARSRKELPEEQPKAYKDVDLVVDVVHTAGLSKKVARFRPIGVIKG